MSKATRLRFPLTARGVALQVLTSVEQEGAYSNLQLNEALQRAELSGADSGLATELVYGTISRRNTIDYFLNQYVQKGVGKLETWVRNLLRLSFYQIYYLDRIPDHAAVSEAVKIAKRLGHQGISGMVNGVLRNILRNVDKLVVPANLPTVSQIALEHSHPEWLVEKWVNWLGDEKTADICQANNVPPANSVRVNTTVITRDKLIAEMKDAGLDVIPSKLAQDGIVVRSGGNMALTSWYKNGLLSVQDESSMLVAEALDVKPNMKVLDCCAAPGGKTCHIAERLEGTGQVIANDVHPHKAKLIEDQAKRLGLKQVKCQISDAMELNNQFAKESFDRILLDAPCSGLGVIRRKPDLKWVKTEEDIANIAQLQGELLHAVSELLKPGGILVYSTCTMEPSENNEVVSTFLSQNLNFSLEMEPFLSQLPVVHQEYQNPAKQGFQIFPDDYHSDGFYISRLRKKA